MPHPCFHQQVKSTVFIALRILTTFVGFYFKRGSLCLTLGFLGADLSFSPELYLMLLGTGLYPEILGGLPAWGSCEGASPRVVTRWA